MEFTPSQSKALEALHSKENLFITGAAGTGKSFIISYYRNHFFPNIPVVSSTGAAAVLVNGRTFHSFFGLGLLNESSEILLARIQTNYFLVNRIKKLSAIIIDEISMLPGRALDMANLICKTIKKNDLPFGGIRIICSGDFYQLPPVSNNKNKVDWAFNSFTWKECNFKIITLKEFMRTQDETYLKFLSKIRDGICSKEETNFMDQFILKPDEDFIATRLFARKLPVFDYNQKELENLSGEMITLKTEFYGTFEDVERLKRNLPIDPEINLKEKAFVMIRINDNSKLQEYVNGTLGHVISVSLNEIVIQTLKGKVIELGKHTFQLKDGDGEILASATNFPLSLAYAVTIHKSQGATLDRAVIDLYNLWDSGQAYTALSRLSGLEGLRITKYNTRSVFVDEDVVNFYKKHSN